MAQLKDTVITGDARVTGTLFAQDGTTTVPGLLSTADKTKLDGVATGAEVNQNAFSNVVVGSTTIAADSKTDTLTMTAGTNIALTPDTTNDKVTIGLTGTVAVGNGGTGKTTGTDAANYFMNSLGTGSSTPVDADYYISQYVNGGTTTTTYHRRPMSALWSYISGKLNSVFGINSTKVSSWDTASANSHSHTNKSVLDGITNTKVSNWDAAEANQNAFSNVTVGSTTVAADSKTDTLTLVAGDNVTLTPDATNDKITIAATDTTYTPASANPLMDGTVAVGTSAKYAREDHVHPHDTSQIAVCKADGKVAEFANGADDSPIVEGTITFAPYYDDDPNAPSSSNIRHINGYTQMNVFLNAARPKHYGVKWDGVSTQCIRTGDAANITVNTSNFVHRGAINPNYNNPFDNIYPWSECKLCNIDVPTYMALQSGDDIKDCVVAWEGDSGFSYTHQYGVWKYRPSFYGASWWGNDGYRYFDISDKPCPNYVFYPENIVGRWWGVDTILTINGTSKHCLLPTVGISASNITLGNLHTYAKNFGATLDNIYTIDGSNLMYLIEFASWHSQASVGRGVDDLYRQSSDKIAADSSGTVIKVLKANAAMCIVDAIIDIGTSNGGIQTGRRRIVSRADDTSDSTLVNLTLDSAITVTTSNFWSIHGLATIADEAIGSMSGYIGTDGKCNAYYRGEVLWGNRWRYVLGVYRATDFHVWICRQESDCDNYDAINTTAHMDTGVILGNASNYIKKLGFMAKRAMLSLYAWCTESAAIASSFAKDYFYIESGAYNRVLMVGGSSSGGSYAGLWCWGWNVSSGGSSWGCAARPSLKLP